jgi:hypothetical protein
VHRRRKDGGGGKTGAAHQRAFDQRAPIERELRVPGILADTLVLTRASSHGKPPLFPARVPASIGRCSDLN